MSVIATLFEQAKDATESTRPHVTLQLGNDGDLAVGVLITDNYRRPCGEHGDPLYVGEVSKHGTQLIIVTADAEPEVILTALIVALWTIAKATEVPA